MRRIELELATARPRWPAWAMAAVGLLLAADAANTWLGLRAQWHDTLRRQGALPVRAAAAEPMTDETRREIESARRLLQELSLPWERMFRAVESAVGTDVALLAIEPDAAKQTLQVSGEARDYTAVLAFMARLEDGHQLQRVHLLSHEVRTDAPERPTQFTLSARWRAQP
jgi:Tfp pilus assembly protein PilN